MTKWVLASHNAGKVKELAELLAPYGIELSSAADHKVPEPEETESTFAGNAKLKALHTAKQTKLPALADDSGLAIDALDGAPGVYSARWAGPEKDFTLAMERIRETLVDAGTHPIGAEAAFICNLCLAEPDGKTQQFEGRVEGTLTFPPRGDLGFGYDPIFIPEGHNQTFGEMQPAEKHAISHRANAFNKLVKAVFKDKKAA